MALNKQERKLLLSFFRSGKVGIAEEVLIQGNRETRIAAGRGLERLLEPGYIERFTNGVDNTGFAVAFCYRISAEGKAYIEKRRADNIDKWITRLCAYLGALTGVAALLWQILITLSK